MKGDGNASQDDYISLMSIGERINQIDSWILEHVAQPVADRLPDRLSALDVGMSCQLGAIVLSGAAVLDMIVVEAVSIGDAMFNVVVWCAELALFVGISRQRKMVRPGVTNPLRFMLAGLRPMSIPFALLDAWQGVTAPPTLALACWFYTLSYIIFVVGIYLISTQPRPPRSRVARQTKLRSIEGGLSNGFGRD